MRVNCEISLKTPLFLIWLDINLIFLFQVSVIDCWFTVCESALEKVVCAASCIIYDLHTCGRCPRFSCKDGLNPRWHQWLGRASALPRLQFRFLSRRTHSPRTGFEEYLQFGLQPKYQGRITFLNENNCYL